MNRVPGLRPEESATTVRPLRIAVIAPSRHPLRQPHAGGLEMCVWERVRGLRARGHAVILSAPDGSDFLSGPPEFVQPVPVWPADAAPSDEAYPPGYEEAAEAALDRAMAVIARSADRIDLVDNHSLHSTPIRWSDRLGVPMLTTLHTPPLVPIVAAHHAAAGADHRFLAVSAHTAGEWAAVGVPATVFPNGVDTDRWREGPGGSRFVWSGRIVPEKAPHLAIDAARAAGRRIVLAGRIGDRDYFDDEVAPRLGPDARWVGPLRQRALARLVGRSAAALVTPVWDEPFGMVIAEAMATGTPVAVFDVGGVREVVAGSPGSETVPAGDVAALAAAGESLARRAERTPSLRHEIRDHAVARHSIEHRHRELESLMAAAVELRPAPRRSPMLRTGWTSFDAETAAVTP